MASEARRKAREAGDVLGSKCLALRAGDAGNAEEELGVQHNTSAVYPTGRVALRFCYTWGSVSRPQSGCLHTPMYKQPEATEQELAHFVFIATVG